MLGVMWVGAWCAMASLASAQAPDGIVVPTPAQARYQDTDFIALVSLRMFSLAQLQTMIMVQSLQ